ncbi:MAG: glutamate synthase-related protein [Anaerolineales bacterium]
MITVLHNPERKALGDSYFNSEYVNAISYEAQEGMIPVRGAGYRGKFGGQGWDGMWTDMSEIVRPTRDGIHGREFISTVVDIGFRPNYLLFDENNQPSGRTPQVLTLPIPFMFDLPPETNANDIVAQVTSQAAAQLESFAVLPIETILSNAINTKAATPLVSKDNFRKLHQLPYSPQLIELDGFDSEVAQFLMQEFSGAINVLRIPFTGGDDLLKYIEFGIHTFHMVADYHGRNADGRFVIDLIRDAHTTLVKAGIRQEVTLIGSGGMIAAEHIPKAIICGLDAIALDTPVLVAMQAKFSGKCKDRASSKFTLPNNLTIDWGVKRLLNLSATWRDQLLEISGAMGIREVRRMRGELGRAMFMKTLEADAFAGVMGYE